MKNTLGDLNNHLFAQLEKLSDDELTGEELESELKRTDAICDISEQIIKNGELQYKAIPIITVLVASKVEWAIGIKYVLIFRKYSKK